MRENIPEEKKLRSKKREGEKQKNSKFKKIWIMIMNLLSFFIIQQKEGCAYQYRIRQYTFGIFAKDFFRSGVSVLCLRQNIPKFSEELQVLQKGAVAPK